jgi:hypothetical protein
MNLCADPTGHPEFWPSPDRNLTAEDAEDAEKRLPFSADMDCGDMSGTTPLFLTRDLAVGHQVASPTAQSCLRTPDVPADGHFLSAFQHFRILAFQRTPKVLRMARVKWRFAAQPDGRCWCWLRHHICRASSGLEWCNHRIVPPPVRVAPFVWPIRAAARR